MLKLWKKTLPNFVIRQITFTNLEPHPTPERFGQSVNGLPIDTVNVIQYLNEISSSVSPTFVISDTNIDLQRIVICLHNVFGNLKISNWDSLIYVNSWLGVSPHLTEISMETLPSFRRLTGPQFIKATHPITYLLNKYLITYRNGLVFEQELKLLMFTGEDGIPGLINKFPNVTELYYVSSGSIGVDTISIDELLNSLEKLQELLIFTDDPQLASSLGEYYLEVPQIKIHLV